jgi:hypothetical protein
MQEGLFPVVEIEEMIGVFFEEKMGDVESFDGGEASRWIGAVGLPSRISGLKRAREAASLGNRR